MFNEWRRLGDFSTGRVSFIHLSPTPILNQIIIVRNDNGHIYVHLAPSPTHINEFNDIFLKFFPEMDNGQSRGEVISTSIILNKTSLSKLKKLFAYLNEKNFKEKSATKAEFPPEIIQELENRLHDTPGLPIEHIIDEANIHSYTHPANDLTDELINLLKEEKTKLSKPKMDKLRGLLNSGANPNAFNHEGASALFYAIGYNLVEVCVLFFNYANPLLPTGNPFDEGYGFYLYNSAELAKRHGHLEIFNLIILNFTPKPQKLISLEKIAMLEGKDQVTTQFLFSDKTKLSTVLKEAKALTQTERKATSQLFDRFFESGIPEDPEYSLKKIFDEVISGENFVENIYNKNKMVGFLVFETLRIESHRELLSKLSELMHFQLMLIIKTKMEFETRSNLFSKLKFLAMLKIYITLQKLHSLVRKSNRTQLVFHCVCSAIDPKYSSNGLMTLLSYRHPFSMLELTDKEIATFFSAIHFFSYRTVQQFLVYPKFRSEKTDKLVDEILRKISQKPVALHRDAMMCHFFDPLKVKAPYYLASTSDLFQYFFNKYILGIHRNEPTTPRAAPILFFAGDESFNHLCSFFRDALNIDFAQHVKELAGHNKLISSKFLTESEPKPTP